MLGRAVRGGQTVSLERGVRGSFGWSTVNGQRLENQDRVIVSSVMSDDGALSLLGVCDGHGGSETAERFRSLFPRLIDTLYSDSKLPVDGRDAYPSFAIATNPSSVVCDSDAPTPPQASSSQASKASSIAASQASAASAADDDPEGPPTQPQNGSAPAAAAAAAAAVVVVPTTPEEWVLTRLSWTTFDVARVLARGTLFDQRGSPIRVLPTPNAGAISRAIVHFDWTALLNRQTSPPPPPPSASASSAAPDAKASPSQAKRYYTL